MGATPIRTMLFVPGNREGWIAKALATGADAVVIDLEGAVPLAEKASARELTRAAIQKHGTEARVFVRTTGARSGTMRDDLEAVVQPGLVGILLPQVVDESDVAVLVEVLDELEPRRGLLRGAC